MFRRTEWKTDRWTTSTGWLAAAIGIALAVLPGCGPTQPQRQAVRGSIHLQGQPLDNVTLVFKPVREGLGATCVVRNGQFAIESAQGPTAGQHTVSIAPIQPDLEEFEQIRATGGKPLELTAVPRKYQKPGQLEVFIEAGVENEIELKLED